MPTRRRRLERASVGALLGLLVVTVLAVPAPAGAADPTDQSYLKYYLVQASYQGHPETLDEIAARFLGGSSRGTEIFDLNSGRGQADGDKLTDPATLHAGWALVLPWDAFGSGVRYGLLPATPKPPDQPTPPAAAVPPPSSGPAQCASTGTPVDGTQDQWGVLRIAPDHAWPYSRGANVLVAVADSGVDASLPALSGRTTEGADIVAGTGRGNTDCLGSGTAMASIIAAHSDAGGSVTGVAPDATILPVRLVANSPDARPADQATAIEFATAAGARVIALGGYVAPADPAVAAAIARAISHDVVVVLGANGSTATDAGVLRVGAVAIDGRPGAAYAPGSVDVVAPGVGVAALGISGTGPLQVTGPQYAVSFVAGEVALVRARFPQLTAAQVAHRVKATADPIGGTAGADEFGAGLINPAVAVTRVIPEENPGAGPATVGKPAGPRPFRIEALIIVGLLVLITAILLILRMRRLIRPIPSELTAPTTAIATGEQTATEQTETVAEVTRPTVLSTGDSTDVRPTEVTSVLTRTGPPDENRRSAYADPGGPRAAGYRAARAARVPDYARQEAGRDPQP